MTIPESTLPPLPALPESLSTIVFTHSSALTSQRPTSNSRLVLLGNSLIHCILTRLLYNHPYNLSKGEINDVRSHYMKNIMRWGMEYDLAGERFFAAMAQIEGDNKKRRAGEVFEAYVGALDCLSHGGNDSGYSEGEDSDGGSQGVSSSGNPATQFVTALILSTLDTTIKRLCTTTRPSPLSPSASSALAIPAQSTYDKSALSKLNQYLSQEKVPPDEVRERWKQREDPTSTTHRFSMGFQVDTDLVVYGEGKTLKEAKARAAERALARMKDGVGSRSGSVSGLIGGRGSRQDFEFEFDAERGSVKESSSVASQKVSRWRRTVSRSGSTAASK